MISHGAFDLHLMIGDVEYLFKYLLAICMSSSEKMYIPLLCPFLTRLFPIKLYELFIYFRYQIYDL